RQRCRPRGKGRRGAARARPARRRGRRRRRPVSRRRARRRGGAARRQLARADPHRRPEPAGGGRGGRRRRPRLSVSATMYRYDDYDRTFVSERVAQFRDQVRRRLAAELTEEEFRPLRLQNGLYLQLHAYMLRVAIPYGTLSSKQLRMLAHIARRYDR